MTPAAQPSRLLIAKRTVRVSDYATESLNWLKDNIDKHRNDPLNFVLRYFQWDDGEGPDVWQEQFLKDLGAKLNSRKFDGKNPVEAVREAVASGHGIGKLQPKSMILDTPTGIRQWGELQPGDSVFGADGKPTAVLDRYEQGTTPIYRVNFDDGSSTLCGLDHLWTVRGRQERRKGLTTWRTITTEDILEIGVKRSNGVSQARQWEIPTQGPAEFEPREIDLHPYFVGLWLGDGTKGQPSYTKPFPELVERLRSLGFHVGENADGKMKRMLGIMHLFTDPIFSLGSSDRYIPDDYKFQSVDNRKELLRGLLDSDGEVGKAGSVGYSSTSKRLIEDVIWLVRSLGGKAMLQPTTKEGWYPGENGERVVCRDCHRATIQLDWNPFTIEHRKKVWKPSESRYLTRWIDSIEYSHDEDSMCIRVDREDGLYLANDFIVTHNSGLTAWLFWWIMMTRPGAKGRITANTFAQLQTITWSEIKKWHKRLKWGGDRFTITDSMCWENSNRDSWFAVPLTCSEENSQAFAGQHNRESTSFFLLDESSNIPDSIFEVSQQGLTDGEPMMFAFGNPTRNSGEFYEICFGKQRHRWGQRSIDARKCKLPNKQEQEKWIQDHGIDSDFCRVRILGLPPSQSELQLIPRALIEGAQSRNVQPLPGDPLIAGVDVPDGGSAWFVVRFRRGLSARPGPLVPAPIRVSGSKIDREAMVSKLAEVLTDRNPARKVAAMFVDSAYGAPLVERLRTMNHRNVFEIRFGGKSPDPRYANMRAYMWAGKMKDWLEHGAIDQNDKKLAEDLMAPGFHHQVGGDGALVLESKEQMQKRGIPPVDDADALALTFAQPVAAPAQNPLSYPPSRGYDGAWMA